MIETLALAGGAIMRLAPEVLNFIDRKEIRKHEVAMAEQARENSKIQADSATSVAQYQALQSAVTAQATLTGVKWVDAINSMMRPLITFWWVIVLPPTVMTAKFIAYLASGVATAQSLDLIWGEPERAITAAIISFWFVDRSIRYMKN